ncbi:MAG: DUF3887 domain-containing protein [Blautia sp.]|nr:DUF3887 domain-containing protein [Blautia sp.]MDY3999233.1 DUF3887 domain-containing protein [Blautia sp.]
MKKHMNKMKNSVKMMAMAVIGAAVFCLAGCGTAKLPDGFDEDRIRESSMEAIGYFNEKDYESLINMGNEQFKDAITEEQFADACDPYLDKNGAFKEITKEVFAGNTDKKTGESYGGVVMVGEYEDGKIQFTIAFDENMELVQFYIK